LLVSEHVVKIQWSKQCDTCLKGENTELSSDPRTNGQVVFDKGVKTTQWGRTVSLINGIGKTGYSYAEEWK
jgi:hypothetical protein